jgi:hypothetical protein
MLFRFALRKGNYKLIRHTCSKYIIELKIS